jgi:hypothetical protein
MTRGVVRALRLQRRLVGNALAERPRNASVCTAAWIVTHPDVSNTAARALIVIAQHVGKTGTAYPGLDRIAKLSGVSMRTAQRAVGELLKHPEAPICRALRRNTSALYSLTRAAHDAPALANAQLKATLPAAPPPLAGDAIHGEAGGDTCGAGAVTPVVRPLGDAGVALTLLNLDRCPAPASPTRTNNDALTEARAQDLAGAATYREDRLANNAPRRTPAPAGMVAAPQARSSRSVCEVDGCGRAATDARGGRYFCAEHGAETSGRPSFWTSGGGRL